jgi:hypothetical protein
MFIETRATWGDLIAGVGLLIGEVFDQGQEEYIVGIGNVLHTSTAPEVAQRNFTGKTGTGEIRKFEDGDDIPANRRFKTYLTSVLYNNYGGSLAVTKNTMMDRDFESDLSEMKDISISANFSQDKSGMQVFNGGFATTVTVNGYDMTWYGDAKPLFSTVHPSVVPGASTQSNASSTGIRFGHDSLEVGMLALELQKTDDGLPMANGGKVQIVIAPALRREAQEETQSVLTPESAENAINVYNGSMDMAVSKFLATTNGGSDTQWTLTVPARHKMYHEVRQAPTLDQETDIMSKTTVFTVDARWADYVKDWRNTWASKGDLATYSS